MAGDYIKREDAINEICLRGCALERQRKLVLSTCEAKQFAVDVIDDIPAADVRENVRGEWSISRTDIGWNGNEYPTHCKCSKCGIEIPYNEPKNYCPRCGADMRGESDERLY